VHNRKQNFNYEISPNRTLIVRNVPEKSTLVLSFDDSEPIKIASNSSNTNGKMMSYFNESLSGRSISAYLESDPRDFKNLLGSYERFAIEISKNLCWCKYS
jgi:hypothetical protein